MIFIFDFKDIEIKCYTENRYFFHYKGVGSGNYLFCKIFNLELEKYIDFLNQYDVITEFGITFFKNGQDAKNALDFLLTIFIINKISE